MSDEAGNSTGQSNEQNQPEPERGAWIDEIFVCVLGFALFGIGVGGIAAAIAAASDASRTNTHAWTGIGACLIASVFAFRELLRISR